MIQAEKETNKMKVRPMKIICNMFLLVYLLSLIGCSQTSPDVYSGKRLGVAQETVEGTVESARTVTVQKPAAALRGLTNLEQKL